MTEPAAKTQISLRVPTELVEAFDTIAKGMERDRSWVMLRALKQYLDSEGADVLRELEGIAALDRGEGVDFDEAMDELDAIIDAAVQRRSKVA
ncbi:transcriptional regulator [Magnetospirillum sp. ME-1]|uniref:CopG family ribbon-helix-helix protein n=1 Tax=Magnetospirillum sp. ME-1 TaxID=1639348 RepID=UPI000A17F02D|nr:ribbon-helix-helix domain-containing protein [Magnetospirillum sp. ME-1]ARJ68156.1 transcriptional regulator [Magnetospirillum sp. ME-1]